ncbi:MAG: cell division protease FtsH [Actinomycetota bacterium]|nr:cell division protease FtsH [Actinomycetota bacterium]
MSPTGTPPGLAWPGPDTGPTPPPEYGDDREPRTRKPMSTWDRSKILLGLALVWLVMFWSLVVDNPIIPVADAFNQAIADRWWLLLLILLESIRQLHYVASERSAGYHQFWTKKVFGGFETKAGRLNDWNRFRVSRAAKRLALVALLAVILGAVNKQSPVLALFQLPGTIWGALPMLLQLLVGVMFVVVQFGALFYFLSRGGVETYFPDDIKTRFSDVWGQDAVVERVKESILFLEAPEAIEARGGYVPGGLLLWGPPGTGKTLMAEAVAGETGKPYVFVDPGAFIQMFMGVGVLKVKSLFRKLRKLAVRYGGVIVFFDEADSLGSRGQLNEGGPLGGQGFGSSPFTATGSFGHAGCNGMSYLSQDTASLLFQQSMGSSGEHSSGDEPRRGIRNRVMMGGMGGGGGMGTLQALLTELSGLKKPRGFMNRVVRRTLGMRPKPPPKYRIMVMMATNMPQALDEALLRPGRIDRIYKVGYPSKAGRIRTYEGYFDKVRHNLSPADIDKLATITPYATGATIKDLVNESLIHAIRNERDTITWADVIKAKQLKDLGPPEDVEYIERERHAVAVHEACHAVTAFKVRRHLTIDIATIEKGGNYLGMVASIPPEDQFTRWRTEYEADVMVSLASLAGERLFFEGDNSSGVSGDLESATQITTLMEGYWGMGNTVTSHGVTQKVGIGGGGRPGKADGKGARNEADLLHGGLGERIEGKLEELLQRAEDLLKANRIAVLAVAHALETHKTVTGDDIEAIIEGRAGPLIDGRVYADPEFARVVEEYHAQAISAHKGHGVFEIALPKLNGQQRRADGGYDQMVVRPDGTYSGTSPWSRPPAVPPVPPVAPPLPPAWPEPVDETNGGADVAPVEANGAADTNGPDANGPDTNGPDANGAAGPDANGTAGSEVRDHPADD